MGFPHDSHIRQFIVGKTVMRLENASKTAFAIRFTDGTSLEVYSNVVTSHEGRTIKIHDEVICTPYAADGEVKQSLAIKHEWNAQQGFHPVR